MASTRRSAALNDNSLNTVTKPMDKVELQKAREKEYKRLFYPDMLPPLSFFLNPPPLFRQ